MFPVGHTSGEANYRHQSPQNIDVDYQFIAMLDSYRPSGGLARAQEVAALSERRGGPDVATLANWIAKREVVCFDWQSHKWLPLFQFNPFDMTRYQELGPVFAELATVYDAWELANWFTQPNPWLANRVPVDTFVSDLGAVLHAARAGRFIANN